VNDGGPSGTSATSRLPIAESGRSSFRACRTRAPSSRVGRLGVGGLCNRNPVQRRIAVTEAAAEPPAGVLIGGRCMRRESSAELRPRRPSLKRPFAAVTRMFGSVCEPGRHSLLDDGGRDRVRRRGPALGRSRADPSTANAAEMARNRQRVEVRTKSRSAAPDVQARRVSRVPGWSMPMWRDHRPTPQSEVGSVSRVFGVPLRGARLQSRMASRRQPPPIARTPPLTDWRRRGTPVASRCADRPGDPLPRRHRRTCREGGQLRRLA
jgi:hypothetical protein